LAIPKLAEGGIVNRPTIAMIGERGPEAVIPLSGRRSQAMNGVVININGNVSAQNPYDLIEELADRISRLWDEKGRGRIR